MRTFLLLAIFAVSSLEPAYASSIDEILHRMAGGKPLTQEQTIVKTYNDKGFLPHDWKAALLNRRGFGFNRYDQFHKFLEEYDLIGMPRSTVLSLLGDPDQADCYTLIVGLCGNAWLGLKIEYEQDSVKRWRLETMTMRQTGLWRNTDVVWRKNTFVSKEGAHTVANPLGNQENFSPPPHFDFAGRKNVLFVLDCSFSMKEKISQGGVKIDIAKSLIRDILTGLPSDTSTGLKVFGTRTKEPFGDSQDCKAIELAEPLRRNNRSRIIGALSNLKPWGMSPLELAIRTAIENDLATATEGTSVILLITDGSDTCGGDPCKVLRDLPPKTVPPIVVACLALRDRVALKQARCIADYSGGVCYRASEFRYLMEDAAKISKGETAVPNEPGPKDPLPRNAHFIKGDYGSSRQQFVPEKGLKDQAQ